MKLLSMMLLATIFLTACSGIPQEARNYYEEGVSLVETGHYSLAIEAYTDAIEVAPSYADAYASRAFAMRALGMVDAMEADIERAFELDPQNARANVMLGILAHDEGDCEVAISYYNLAIASKSDYANAFNNRALCYESLGNLEQAETDYLQALELDPDSTLIQRNFEIFQDSQDS
ncbi:MAG: tetratricopeptide repeat protein [Chloroflexota bacterium]